MSRFTSIAFQPSVLFLLMPLAVHSAKILLLSAPIYSHCLEVSSVGQELANRGHNVSMLLGSNFNHKNCFRKNSDGNKIIHPIIIKSKPNLKTIEQASLDMSTLMENEEFNIFKHLGKADEFTSLLCQNLLWNKEGINSLKKEKFDLAIVDGFFLSYCIYLIPHVLDLPHVSVSTTFDDWIVARPTLPSIVPGPVSKFTSDMSFWERLANAFTYLIFHLLSRYVMPLEIINEFAPGISSQDVLHMAASSRLYLYNYDTVLGYPVPTMPNHVLVGGLATAPAKPLDKEFSKIYNQSKSDIVLVTFGSSFGLLPEKVENNLVQALKRLKITVVWKYLKSGEDGNIKKVSWLPQNDLLGNSKTKLFISHCGNNGLFEALYHGVPILCTPLFGDQFTNAMRVQHWKVGRYTNLIMSTEDDLFAAITDIMTTPNYRENMRKASAIFHSRPMNPRQRAAFWVEHVLKFGGGYLRSRGSDLCVLSYLGYDCLIFVLFVLFLVLCALYKSVVCCCHCCVKAKQDKIKTS
ncbi:UDP-glucuronosyltransferase 2C1-like [Liolophura sinensis]|uniref:UDP-glucuronosyltransferase 2C1-like n=1 Tax=Liolophura sinensis TaxID=3198878 RepID=UPI003159148E